MKKIIIILAIALIILGIAAGIILSGHRHTVSDFQVFPCQFYKADQITIAHQQQIQFEKKGQIWQLSKPSQEPVEPQAMQQLAQFLYAKMLVDDQRELTPQTHQSLAIPNPTVVKFYHAGEELCEFELGQGQKYATADSERRWVFMGDKAYRAFVPLMDFGPMFEQPLSAWRIREFFSLGTRDILSLEIQSNREHFKVDRQGTQRRGNPQGWRLASANTSEMPVDIAKFKIDERRIATVVELLTPFIIDDWADNLSPDEIQQMQYGGSITVGTQKRDYRIQIGPEVNYTQHPEWMNLGEGARYIRVDGDERIGLISSRRLLGIFPALDDMRTKSVWDADSTHLAAIEIQVNANCLRYQPKGADVWVSTACLHADTQVDSKTIPNTELANYAKVINSLQAVRYATPEEKSEITLGAVQIRLFMDEPTHLAYILNMSESIRNLFRYAQVQSENENGQMTAGPIFVLTEGISKILLSDLTSEL